MKPNLNRIIAVMSLAVLGGASCELPAQAQMQYRQGVQSRSSDESQIRSTSSDSPQELAGAVYDRETRQYVASEILSLKDISRDDAMRIENVLRRVSVFRRLPVYQIEADKSMVMFMAKHPDSVVSIWDKQGISQISVRERAEGLYEVSDVAGTNGWMKRVWSGENGVLYYLEGGYRGSLLSGNIRGKVLVLARFSKQVNAKGVEMTSCYVDTFLSLDQEFFDASVRLLFPMLGKVADNNLEITMGFVGKYAEMCKKSPVSLSAYAMSLDNVSEQTRQDLARETGLTAYREQERIKRYEQRVSMSEVQTYGPQQANTIPSYGYSHLYVSEPVRQASPRQEPVRQEPTPVRVGYPPVGNDAYQSLEIFDDEEY